MICNSCLSWALLLIAIGSVLAHPASETADVSYSPDLTEEAEVVNPEELYLKSFLQKTAGLNYSPLLSRDGLKVSGQLSKDALKEMLLNKPGSLTSLSQVLGIKRPYRKRGADCFWKYCV